MERIDWKLHRMNEQMQMKWWKRGNLMNWDKLVDMISNFRLFYESWSYTRMALVTVIDRFGVLEVEMDNIALSSHFIFFL